MCLILTSVWNWTVEWILNTMYMCLKYLKFATHINCCYTSCKICMKIAEFSKLYKVKRKHNIYTYSLFQSTLCLPYVDKICHVNVYTSKFDHIEESFCNIAFFNFPYFICQEELSLEMLARWFTIVNEWMPRILWSSKTKFHVLTNNNLLVWRMWISRRLF